METEQRIAAAKEVVRHLLGRYSKPGQRMHAGAAFDNDSRLRALKGLCGECANLKIKFVHRDGKDRVALGCSKRHSPLALYRDTPLGEEASCNDYAKRVRK